MVQRFYILVLLAGLLACAKTESANTPEAAAIPTALPEKIDFFIENDRYEEALSALENEPVNEETLQLREKAHLNYGIHTVYQADPSTMRENANKGLRQFIKVLDINRDNEKAISEIENIMSIYASLNRSPEESVLEELRRLGFNY